MQLYKIVRITGLGVLLLPLLFAQAQEEKTKEDKPQATQVSIPKDQIYTTSAEPGFKKRLVAVFRRDKVDREKGVYPYSYDLKVLENQGMGASNIFIVRGDEIKDAVSATRLVFARAVGADEPRKLDANDQEITGKRYWLLVYLGMAGSDPPNWQFKSMSVSDRTIEFTYSKMMPRIRSTDVCQYFYWVPLPELRTGAYELRLFDSGKKRPSLIRYVDIS